MKPTFDPAWLSPGAHVTCVTRRELSDELVAPADRVLQLGINTVPYGTPVPDMDWKAGGIASYVSGQPHERARIPRAKQRCRDGRVPDPRRRPPGQAEARTSDEQITLFVTIGTQGLQFAAVGGRVWQLAQERDLGHAFPTEWFLQHIRD